MSDLEKVVAIAFFIVGFFVGGLGGLTLGAELTLNETMQEVCHD
jgi:hypothetical protein